MYIIQATPFLAAIYLTKVAMLLCHVSTALCLKLFWNAGTATDNSRIP